MPPGAKVRLRRLQNLDEVEAEKRQSEARDPNIREYLTARALIGRKTAEAKTLLENLIGRAPGLPQAHSELVDVFRRPRFKDPLGVRKHVLEYRRLCPASIEGFSMLDRMADSALSREAAPLMRRVLEKRAGENRFDGWETLWKMEFRALPASRYDSERDVVRKDLQRLKADGALRSRGGLEALIEGTTLVQDEAGQTAAESALIAASPNSRAALVHTFSAWRHAHKRPADNGAEEQLQAYYLAWYDAACEWVARWPRSALAWLELRPRTR